MNFKASDYCRELAGLLERVQVTDRDGGIMVFDVGASRALDLILTTRESGRKAMIVGNGGSAAIGAHLQNDLSKAAGIRAMTFTESSLLTALSNDEGYENAYAHQVRQWAEPGDLLIAVSSSGKSQNILRCATVAESAGVNVLTMTGFGADNPLRRTGDVNFYVPASQYGPVELSHQIIAHMLTDAAMIAVGELTQGDAHELASDAAGAGDRRGGIRRRRASA